MSTRNDLAAKSIVLVFDRHVDYPGFRENWAQVVAAIIAKAIEISKERKFDRWKDEVSKKLGEIIEQLAAIQQQLRDLQVWIDERISEESRNVYHRRIITLCKHVDQVVDAIGQQENLPTESQISDITADFRELRITISDLMQTDGYFHAMAVVTGVVCLLPIFFLLHREKEIASFAQDVGNYLGAAISPTDRKSLEAARITQASRIAALTQTLSSRIGVAWLTNYTDPIDRNTFADSDEKKGGGNLPPIPGKATAQTAIQIESGEFRLGGRSGVPLSNLPPWYPELSDHLPVGEEDASWAMMLANLNGHRAALLQLEEYEGVLSSNIDEIRGVKEQLDQLT
jgi:hypothetical protein